MNCILGTLKKAQFIKSQRMVLRTYVGNWSMPSRSDPSDCSDGADTLVLEVELAPSHPEARSGHDP